MADDNVTIIFSGWATKEGSFVKNWKRRFFVLRDALPAERDSHVNATHMLLYFKSQEQAASGEPPKGAIAIVKGHTVASRVVHHRTHSKSPPASSPFSTSSSPPPSSNPTNQQCIKIETARSGFMSFGSRLFYMIPDEEAADDWMGALVNLEATSNADLRRQTLGSSPIRPVLMKSIGLDLDEIETEEGDELTAFYGEGGMLGMSKSFCQSEYDRLKGMNDNTTMKLFTYTERLREAVPLYQTSNKPISARHTSDVDESGHPTTGVATVLISHPWDMLATEFFQGVLSHMQPDDYAWIDLYSMKPFRSRDRIKSSWIKQFERMIGKIGRVVTIMTPFSNPTTLRRAWCLFEMVCAIRSNAALEIALPTSCEQSFLTSTVLNQNQTATALLAKVFFENAKTHVAADLRVVFEVVETMPGGSYEVNVVIKKYLRQWVLDKLERLVEYHQQQHQQQHQKHHQKQQQQQQHGQGSTLVGTRKIDLKFATLCHQVALIFKQHAEYDKALEYLAKAVDIIESDQQMQHDESTNISQSQNNVDVDVDADSKASPSSSSTTTPTTPTPPSRSPSSSSTTTTTTPTPPSCPISTQPIALPPWEVQPVPLPTAEPVEFVEPDTAFHDLVVNTHVLDAGSSHLHIGLVYELKGEFDDALSHFQKALTICEATLEKDDPAIATVYSCIGLAHGSKGRFTEALEYQMKALEIREQHLSTSHPDTADSHCNIAALYDDEGNYEMAMEHYSAAIEIQSTALGDDHLVAAISYNNVGIVCKNKGDFDEALKYYFMALTIVETQLGADHPHAASINNNVGSVFELKGDYDSALEFYFKALAIDESMNGLCHPDTATSWGNIGMVYHYKGENNKALEFQLKACAVREDCLGNNHIATANSYHNIGALHDAMGDFEQALKHLLKALAIHESRLGHNHPNTASTYHMIGLAYATTHDFTKAFDYHSKALAARQTSLAADHPDTASSYYNVALTYTREGDFARGLTNYKRALSIRERRLGYYHPLTLICRDNVKAIIKAQGFRERIYINE